MSDKAEEELREMKVTELRARLTKMGLKTPKRKDEMIKLIIKKSKELKKKEKKTAPGTSTDLNGKLEEEEAAATAKESNEETEQRKETVENKKEDIAKEEKEPTPEKKSIAEEKEPKEKKKESEDVETRKAVKKEDEKSEAQNEQQQQHHEETKDEEEKEEKEKEKEKEKEREEDEDISNRVAESPAEPQARVQEHEAMQRAETPSKMEDIEEDNSNSSSNNNNDDSDDDVYASAPAQNTAEVEEGGMNEKEEVGQSDKLKETNNNSNSSANESSDIAESCIVHVSGIVRPFSNEDAEELFTKHGGPLNYCWMNRVKSNAYVSYKTLADAARAVKELNGMVLQNGSKSKLTAKFSDEAVAVRVIQNDAQVNRNPLAIRLAREFRESGLLQAYTAKARTAQPSKATQGEPGKKTTEPEEKGGIENNEDDEDVHQPPKKKANMRLDSLFMKTKSEPHLYYLPLTEQEAAERDKAAKEKKAKEEQSKKKKKKEQQTTPSTK